MSNRNDTSEASPLATVPKDVVLAWRAGWSVIPQLSSKRACIRWKPYQERQPVQEELEKWGQEYPGCNWAVACGQVSDLLVLDFDGEEGEATRGRLGLEPTIRTPSNGSHVYVYAPEFPVRGGARVDPKKYPGMDVRAEGQLATFHGKRDGAKYTKADGAGILPFEKLPRKLRDFLSERERKEHHEFALPEGFTAFVPADKLLEEAIAHISDNGSSRNEVGFLLALQLRDERQSFQTAEAILYKFADAVGANGSHPYTRQEAYNSLVSAYSRPPREPRNLAGPLLADGFRRTEYGNAERLVARHGDKLRYCHVWDAWLYWDGRRWERDATAEVERLAKETVRAMYEAAESVKDPDARKALRVWANMSESAGKISSMVRLAQSEKQVVVRPEELDRDPWLFNVINGTIDLRTGNLRDHSRDDLITKLAPVEHDISAKCPRFHRFLKEVLPDVHDRKWLRRLAGYCLTGDISEQCFVILQGPGANGKSTFIETFAALLGEYAQQAPTDLLLQKRPGGIPLEVARLRGARFVTAMEVDEGRRLAEALVKQLTGGDRVTARKLYAEYEEFIPVAKLVLGTNHKPEIRGTGDAIWRRIRLLPFNVIIAEKRRDKNLPRTLHKELSGILNWALQGLREWRESELGSSPNIVAATKDYRTEQDLLGAFVADRCREGNDYSATAEELYSAYKWWAEESGVRLPMTQQNFGRHLSDRGFRRDRIGAHKVHTWFGLKLRGSTGKTKAKAEAHG